MFHDKGNNHYECHAKSQVQGYADAMKGKIDVNLQK